MRPPFATVAARDHALAKYLEHLCYLDTKRYALGSSTFHGYMHIFPQERDSLKESARALKGWERLETQGEGGPLSWESVGAAIEVAAEAGDFWSMVAMLISFDCWLREQEWVQLRRGDIAAHGPIEEFLRDGSGPDLIEVALLFGVRERGQNVKTGSNQGVILCLAIAKFVLLHVIRGLGQHEGVFPITAAFYRGQWWSTLRRLGIEWAGPPRNLRHTGQAFSSQEAAPWKQQGEEADGILARAFSATRRRIGW